MTSLVARWGPLGIFLLMAPESACIPVPSEVTLIGAGIAVREDLMPFWVAVAAAAAGNLAGSLVAYGIGRAAAARGGEMWVGRALARCDRLFALHGGRAVLVARLMPLARTFAPLPAGHARVGIGRFVLMTTIGCAVWAIVFVLLGALVGSGWSEQRGTIERPFTALAALAVVAILIVQRRGAGEQ